MADLKLEQLKLAPDELIQYQNFYQQQGAAMAEIGRITMEYQGALEQAKAVLSQMNQAREQWIIRALSVRGINPATGNWEIMPQTGDIINKTKLRAVES